VCGDALVMWTPVLDALLGGSHLGSTWFIWGFDVCPKGGRGGGL